MEAPADARNFQLLNPPMLISVHQMQPSNSHEDVGSQLTPDSSLWQSTWQICCRSSHMARQHHQSLHVTHHVQAPYCTPLTLLSLLSKLLLHRFGCSPRTCMLIAQTNRSLPAQMSGHQRLLRAWCAIPIPWTTDDTLLVQRQISSWVSEVVWLIWSGRLLISWTGSTWRSSEIPMIVD